MLLFFIFSVTLELVKINVLCYTRVNGWSVPEKRRNYVKRKNSYFRSQRKYCCI